LNEHCIAAYQQVGDFEVTKVNGQVRKNGGNVVSYFLTPKGLVIDAVIGPVAADKLLSEAQWSERLFDQLSQGQLPQGRVSQGRSTSAVELVRQAHLGSRGDFCLEVDGAETTVLREYSMPQWNPSVPPHGCSDTGLAGSAAVKRVGLLVPPSATWSLGLAAPDSGARTCACSGGSAAPATSVQTQQTAPGSAPKRFRLFPVAAANLGGLAVACENQTAESRTTFNGKAFPSRWSADTT